MFRVCSYLQLKKVVIINLPSGFQLLGRIEGHDEKLHFSTYVFMYVYIYIYIHHTNPEKTPFQRT